MTAVVSVHLTCDVRSRGCEHVPPPMSPTTPEGARRVAAARGWEYDPAADVDTCPSCAAARDRTPNAGKYAAVTARGPVVDYRGRGG